MAKTTEKRAAIGKAVAEMAVRANPDLKKSYARLSNWRQGLSLPPLEEFLDFCAKTQTTDISPLIEKTTSLCQKST